MMTENFAVKFFKKVIDLRFEVLFLFGIISLFGFYCLSTIKIDAIPDITNKQVIVNTKTFGMDPTIVEKAITYPIESELYGIPNLVEMRSISKFGLSQIVLVFDDVCDIYFARNQVMQRLSALKDQLPPNISPTIAPLTTGIGEIIIYRLYNSNGKDDLMELRAFQEYKIARELKRIKGVAEVDTIGGFKRELHLNLDSKKLANQGMTAKKIVEQIQTIGENFGGGYIEQNGEQKVVRTFANLDSYQDIMEIPVKVNYLGKAVPLKHIVEVRQDYSQRLGTATNKSNEVVLGTVMLQSGENSREVLIDVKKEILKLNKKNPNVQIELLYDRQFLIDSTIKTVIKNLLEGILLVVAVLCLVLGNFKAGLVVASCLLFSILILAACMKIFGISANLMSLGAIDFGLLVDSSVVLVEYIITKIYANKNQNKSTLIAELSAQMLKPIVIGIVIIILVYMPILSFIGIEGKTFKPMAFNVIIAMSASLIVTFFLMPILSYFFIDANSHQEQNFFTKIGTFYEKVLQKVFKKTRFVIISCLLFFSLCLLLFLFIPSDFLPKLNEGDLVFTVVAKEGASLSQTTAITQEIEKNLAQEKEIATTFSRVGISEAGLDLMPQNSADIFVILKEKYKIFAPKKAEIFYNKIKQSCPSCTITQSQPIEMRFNEMLEGSRADLSLRIFGENFDQLISITKKIEDLLKNKREIKTIEKDFINSIRKSSFVDIVPNYTQIAKYQISISDVNNELAGTMAGLKVGNFYAGEFPIAIMLHLDEENRSQISAIKNISIGLKDGGSFALEKVADVRESQDISSIPRIFGKRYSSISIYLNNTNYAEFIKKAQQEITANNILPNGYYLEWGGKFENFASAKKKIFILIPFVIALIFFLLYKIFADFKKVLIVFSSVPFAISGAILLLFIFKISITISVYIGFIALIGISLLNSIILLNTFKETGDLMLSCLSRLRPILMTALVASLGFLPMAFGNGIGSEVQQPIAITVIGGIISSMYGGYMCYSMGCMAAYFVS